MNLKELKLEYNYLLNGTSKITITDFVNLLIEHSDASVIEFQYSLLKNFDNNDLFYAIRGEFYRHKKDGKIFLLNKIKTEKDIDLKAEALFILGGLDDLTLDEIDLIKNVAKNFLKNYTEYKFQYYGIIVIGWIGKKEELALLNYELQNNTHVQLRGYAASALRQIWYEHPRLKKSILKIYYDALTNELDEKVNLDIVASVQTLLMKKFGIKETIYGEVLGDISKAKEKAIKAIDKVFKEMICFMYDVETDNGFEEEVLSLNEAIEEFYYLSDEKGSFFGIETKNQQIIQFSWEDDDTWLVDIPLKSTFQSDSTVTSLQKYANYDECINIIENTYNEKSINNLYKVLTMNETLDEVKSRTTIISKYKLNIKTGVLELKRKN